MEDQAATIIQKFYRARLSTSCSKAMQTEPSENIQATV
jgi:hypothetical protein